MSTLSNAHIVNEWFNLRRPALMKRLEGMSSAEVERLVRVLLADGGNDASGVFYSLYHCYGELVDTALDKYERLRPNYRPIVTQAVADKVLTTFDALLFSLQDVDFIANLDLTADEKALYEQMVKLLTGDDDE